MKSFTDDEMIAFLMDHASIDIQNVAAEAETMRNKMINVGDAVNEVAQTINGFNV